MISGEVKAVISLSSRYVRFVGQEGQDLSRSIDIRPIDGHTFAIKNIKMKKGQYLAYDLKSLGKPPGIDGYTLIVQNLMKTEGFYQDLIVVETDSPKKPSLRIPVSARIRKAAHPKNPPADD